MKKWKEVNLYSGQEIEENDAQETEEMAVVEEPLTSTQVMEDPDDDILLVRKDLVATFV